MKAFFSPLMLSLVLLTGSVSIAAAQDFGMDMGMGMDMPKATAGAKATVESYSTEPFLIVNEVKLPEHWHSYYKNPGTVGMPMEATLKAPTGFRVEGPFWQVPAKEDGMVTFYGYSGVGKMAFRITPEANAPQDATFTTSITWQMCAEQCAAPETKESAVKLSKGDGKATADAAELAKGLVGITTPEWAKNLKAAIAQKDKTLTLTLNTATALPSDKVYFFCDNGEVAPEAPQTLKKVNDTTYELTMTFNDDPDGLYPNNLEDKTKPVTDITGILRVGDEGVNVNTAGSTAVAAPTAPAKAETTDAAKPAEEKAVGVDENEYAEVDGSLIKYQDLDRQEEPMGLGKIFIFMFLGGIILNVMPCVFPVIGLKVMGFVQMGGGDRKKVLAHSLTFVLGILLSFWAITLILIALKASPSGPGFFSTDFWFGGGENAAVSWAFWFENNWVKFGLLALMMAMGLSMFGVFEIGVKATTVGGELQQKEGYAGSFWSGILATVIATPCSAPLLGPAIGAALLQPPFYIFLSLTLMGVGMAFPYIILGAFPSLIKYLPKPGAWMESFKQAMSFLLFGTAAYLLWIYLPTFHEQLDALMLLFGIIIFSMAFWIYGRWCPMYRTVKSRVTGGIFALIFLSLGIFFMLPPAEEVKDAAAADTQLTAKKGEWQPWSRAAMVKALQAGKSVYVDFTARWCATCQVNKASYTDEVLNDFHNKGIILMKADKTKANPAIDKELRKLKRGAIPVNVLYRPNKAPAITIELLTPSYLIEFVNKEMAK